MEAQPRRSASLGAKVLLAVLVTVITIVILGLACIDSASIAPLFGK